MSNPAGVIGSQFLDADAAQALVELGEPRLAGTKRVRFSLPEEGSQRKRSAKGPTVSKKASEGQRVRIISQAQADRAVASGQMRPVGGPVRVCLSERQLAYIKKVAAEAARSAVEWARREHANPAERVPTPVAVAQVAAAAVESVRRAYSDIPNPARRSTTFKIVHDGIFTRLVPISPEDSGETR